MLALSTRDGIRATIDDNRQCAEDSSCYAPADALATRNRSSRNSRRFPQGQFQFQVLQLDIVEARLKAFVRKHGEREKELKALFQEAGCEGGHLSQQAVKHLKEPNVIYTLPGRANAVILVGAYYDLVDLGDGVVDNWSGASLLPSLFQVLKTQPRSHT